MISIAQIKDQTHLIAFIHICIIIEIAKHSKQSNQNSLEELHAQF